jgi:hypothetical protein
VKQDGIFHWIEYVSKLEGGETTSGVRSGDYCDKYQYEDDIEAFRYYSVFTVAELGEMLPEEVDPQNGATYLLSIFKIGGE